MLQTNKTIFQTSVSQDEAKIVKDKLLEYGEIFSKLPKNTKRAYERDMNHFLNWCGHHNINSLQPDLEHNKKTLKSYFKSLIEAELSRATIVRHKAPLAKFLSILEWPSPFKDHLFKEWLSVSLKARPAFQKQAPALTHDLLEVINDKLDENCSMQLRDKVMLNIMFDGLLRANEVCSLLCQDISFRRKTLFLAQSKTDQEARGTYRALSDTSLRLIELWKSRYAIDDGFLLRSLTPSKTVTKRGLQYNAVYEAFHRFSKMVNIDNEIFTTHSARIGGAVTLAEHDCNILDIQHAGGWKTTTMPARYTEQINIHKKGMGAVNRILNR
jgi:site-specific recombinase XerD